jgi:hypothetical protein
LPPWRSKKSSTFARRSSLIPTFGPWRTRKARPRRRPSQRLVRSPATAAVHAIAISRTTSISPWPATSPPTSMIVSPGAISPTNAPVSKKAITPTSK